MLNTPCQCRAEDVGMQKGAVGQGRTESQRSTPPVRTEHVAENQVNCRDEWRGSTAHGRGQPNHKSMWMGRKEECETEERGENMLTFQASFCVLPSADSSEVPCVPGIIIACGIAGWMPPECAAQFLGGP